MSKRNGALRVVRSSKSCRKGTKQQGGEFPISWNQKGPPGKQGARGPGAQSFDTPLVQGTVGATLATLNNGLTITGTCTNGPAHAELRIQATTNSTDSIQLSGTGSEGSTLSVFDTNGSGDKLIGGPTTVDLDVIGRDGTLGGKFTRIDVHGLFGVPCEFWGMITPAS